MQLRSSVPQAGSARRPTAGPPSRDTARRSSAAVRASAPRSGGPAGGAPRAPPPGAASAAASAPAASIASLPLAPGPAPSPLPALEDETLALAANPLQYALDARARHGGGGPVFRVPVFMQGNVYMVVTTDAITDILADDGNSVAFNNSEAFKRLMRDEVSNETMANGALRMQQRRMLSPAFSNDALNAYVPIMVEQVEQSLAGLVSSEGRSFDLRYEVRTMTVDLANNLLVGITGLDEATKRRLQELMDDFFIGTQTQMISLLPGSPFMKAMEARKELDELLKPRLVEQRDAMMGRGRIGRGAKPRKSVLATMMEARIAMGDEDALSDLDALTNQCIGILLAGIDTSGSGFTNTLLALTQLPGVVEKLREEQRRVVEAHGPAITRAALDAMPYLDAVVREVQYISPSGALNFRHTQRDIDVQGRRVPKDSLLLLHWQAAHALEDAEQRGRPGPAMFKNAKSPVLDKEYLEQVFYPERWMAGSGAPRPTMLSFHHGPFTCLGMMLYFLEAKSVVATLLRNYDLQLLSEPAYIPWMHMPMSVPDKRWPVWARLTANPL
ncbi:cytochrome P450 [Raphidocelis subcapitata]|uniref:Cytochrome P450 n=1 Tax=Raphidocelis subcapitata TaxID=307507 RepID=A0A2V0NSR1_9CHLO|nr:cytochrome P450 [Raphidocelis subcapitata]|eukprot:GBF87875.1 cytochrome P450 [Raphidocelis subcapitata]